MVQQARYQIRIQNTAGITQAVFDGASFRSLDYEKRLNDFSTLTFSIDGGDDRKALFTTDAIIQVWRRPDGHDWYKDAEFFHRSPEDTETETNLKIFTSFGRGFVDLLHRREIYYTGTTAYTQKAGSGEGVMKDYVYENAGLGAGDPLRKRSGITQGLRIDADQDRGLIWRGQRSFRNLLDVLQEIALATKVDFDVIRTNTDGTPDFLFVTNYPQLGRDLSLSVIFDTRFGNMLAPVYTKSRTEEANVVAILGQGEDISRVVIVSTASTTEDSPWNDIEVSQDARNQTTTEQLFTIGEEQLAKLAAQELFTFQVVQTEGTQYGIHYQLGDRVTAQFNNVIAVKKLSRVHINVADGKETIDTEFSDVVTGSIDPFSDVVRNLNTRLREIATR